MIDTTKAENETRKHIARVSELMGEAAIELIRRGANHDSSKFTIAELHPLQRMQDLIDKEGQAPFGSEEYKRRTSLLGDMIPHHHAHNSHHPEYYDNGIDGMTLFDLIEMFFDWKAASERGHESWVNIGKCCERFSISSQLSSIIYNTAIELDYKVDDMK